MNNTPADAKQPNMPIPNAPGDIAAQDAMLHESQPTANIDDTANAEEDLNIDALLEGDGEDMDDEDMDDEDEEEDENDFEIQDEITPPRPLDGLEAEEKAILMASAADAVRAEDITILDLRQLTIIADFFLICTGKSSIQLRAIADRIEEKMRDSGVRRPRMEGYQEATWILLDYGDVVVHLMAAEQRAFYRLEEFWDAAPRVALNLLPEDARGLRGNPSGFETLTPPEGDFALSEDDLT